MIVVMENVVLYIGFVLLGLCMGSFAGATTWRLRAYQLKGDKKDGQKVNEAEYKRLLPLTKAKLSNDRSRCLHCGYELRWYDLIPVFSWLSLGGKCRQCRHKIGSFELLIELGTAAFFVASYALWPDALSTWYGVTHLVLWLVAGVALAILFAYDAKWFLLPDRVTLFAGSIGGVVAIMSIITATQPLMQLLSVLGSVAVLGGIYWLLYEISRHKWVGFGDVKLGLALGLLLADWRLAFIALFAANLVGSLLVLPGLVTGKLKGSSHVPFGPLMIVGAVIAQLVGPDLVTYYLQHFLIY